MFKEGIKTVKVIQNTYPKHSKIPYAEIGDEVRWELCGGQFNLVRIRDNKSLFGTAPVNRDGLLRSNKKQPTLIGVIAQVKSKGWILEVG